MANVGMSWARSSVLVVVTSAALVAGAVTPVQASEDAADAIPIDQVDVAGIVPPLTSEDLEIPHAEVPAGTFDATEGSS